jgi:hypothetical protein
MTRALLRREPLLAGFALLCMVLLAPTLVALALDARRLAGVPVWLKPVKFQLSLAVHAITVALALGMLAPRPRASWAARIAVAGIVVASLLELVWIMVQGARARPSHFPDTPFQQAMFVAMGVGATVIVVATAVLGALLMAAPRPEAPRWLARAFGVGLLLSGVLGLLTGFAIGESGGYRVGTPPPGAGTLPLFGWSFAVGDLRVAHFLGLHAAQAVPLLAWAAGGLRWPALGLLGAAWTAATLAAMQQAFAGRPPIPFG